MKYILSLVFLNLSLYAQVSHLDYTEIQDLSIPSAFSDREVEKVILKNGLQAYLVSDPFVQQSAAAVVVEAGSWEDPEKYPGMAHFVEHLLFMGTKTYPKESEYSQFIKDRQGLENALTSADKTVYMFSIETEAYKPALDRFSHFFIDPLFSTNCISRELHAVDQEHAKSIESDMQRQYMVFKETGNPKHPNHNFSCGNQETLSRIPLSDLQDWYQAQYSANRMHLVMISSLPIAEMRNLAVEKFSSISNAADQKKLPQGSLLSDQQKGSMVFIKPIKELKTLTLCWEIPSTFSSLDEKFPEFIAYILNKQVKGSLLAKLKKENIAKNLSVDCHRLSKDQSLFSIDVFLTDPGLMQTDTAISYVFAALQRLKLEPLDDLFKEFKTICTQRLIYESMDNVYEKVIELASDIIYEDLSTYPTKTKIPSSFDKEKFSEDFLAALNPSDCIYSLIADPNEMGVVLDQKEQWMQVEYTLVPIDLKRLQEWKDVLVNPEITLPEANPYLQDVQDNPILIGQDESAEVYFKRTYSSANGLAFQFRSPLLDQTPKSGVLAELWLYALNDLLADDLCFASDAGIGINTDLNPLYFYFEIIGSNEKVLLLTKKIFQAAKQVSISEEKFQTYVSSLSTQYKNSSKKLALFQAQMEMESIISHSPCNQQKLLALQDLSWKDFLDFSEEFSECLYTRAFLYVDLSQNQAIELFQELQTILNTKAYPLTQHIEAKVLVLSDLNNPSKLVLKTEQQGSGIVVLLQEGSSSFESRAVQKVLSQALQTAFFEALRTQQQTAYLVHSYAQERENQLLQYFNIQSNTHTANDLLARFELFLKDFDKNLDTEISLERFETIRSSIVSSLKNMAKENFSDRLRTLFTLSFYYQDFERIKKLIDNLNALSYEQFCMLSHQMLSKDNPRKLAVLVEGEVPTKDDNSYYELSCREDVQMLGGFVPHSD
ncbi:insulinase family protein [Candidatus Rhabdochlamydia sp. T3358]|uniref:insulinase family protein n=1 Tax=Candidatus Rhabdochlamydia sp. T3358 TaxID=2099795 RepID=UPI0010B8662D|nr:insulinase family protein [Candidatus Rhabdochlamydia sp. T3358]VHO03151.1 Protease 3 precursor [Candidatus Rhabdochlamydia sp. T3358]